MDTPFTEPMNVAEPTPAKSGNAVALLAHKISQALFLQQNVAFLQKQYDRNSNTKYEIKFVN